MYMHVVLAHSAGVHSVRMIDDVEKSICQEDLSCPRQQLIGIEGIESEVKVVAVGLGEGQEVAKGNDEREKGI